MTGQKTTGTAERVSGEPNDALGRAMSELVHDLANDIVVLQGWAHLARGEAAAGRPAAAELDRLTDVADTVGRMLHDLLTVADGQPISPEIDFSPHAVTETTLAQRVVELSSLTVRFRSDLPANARVRGFGSFWSRILANLLSNSARHARSRLEVSLSVSHGDVVLRVEDDGAGVGEGIRDRLFRPRGTAASGVGLGLSSVAWLTGQLGGTVRLVDSRGSEEQRLGGAAFEVRVPVAEPVRKMNPATAVDSLRGLRILLVDDDAAVRQALSRLLRRIGADVREMDPIAKSDDELLADIAAAEAGILLLDIRMGRRGGTALWRRLAARAPRLAGRVVFVSGTGPGDPDWEDAASSGQPLLGKPFTLQQLAEAIARLG